MLTQLKINNIIPQKPKSISFSGQPKVEIDLGLDLIPNGQSIVYFSDTHSNISILPKLAGFINMVQKKLKREHLIKICTGDFLFGKEARNAEPITQVFNKIKLNFLVPGNHEFDVPLGKLQEILKNMSMPVLGANINKLFPDLDVSGHCLIKTTKQNYGAVGITLDTKDKGGNLINKDISKIVEIVQQKVDKLTEQGVNRIILGSHCGINIDRQIAQQTSGIDIIISAHDHKNINGVEKSKNLLNSKTNEPVAIFQASENGNSIGYARVAFDNKGVLTKVFNKVLSTSNKYISEDKETLAILSESLSLKPLGCLVNEGSMKNINTGENALANWLADTVKKELKTPQVVIFDSRIVRAGLNAGKIREFNIDEMLPLRNARESECFKTIEINGKQIKALIQKLTNITDQSAPIKVAQVSGLKYSVNNLNQIKDLKIETHEGNFESLKDDKNYTVALQDFIISGKKFEKLGLFKARVITEHNKTPQESIKDYLQSEPHIIKLHKDQRIKVK